MISIIIVTYNSSDCIKENLISIQKNLIQLNYEIIIVDNYSTDNTLEIIYTYLGKITDNVKVIENKKNNGFGHANNIGVAESIGEYLFFLNPDCKLLTNLDINSIDLLNNSNTGIIAPKIINSKNEIQFSIFYSFPSLFSLLNDLYLKRKIFSDIFIYGKREINPIHYNNIIKTKNIKHVSGAAFLMKKLTFETIGGFDSRYFLYLEETDLMRKIISNNLLIKYNPHIVVKHFQGLSSSKAFLDDKKNIIILNSLVLFHKFNNSYLTYKLSKFFIKMYALTKYIYFSIRRRKDKLKYAEELYYIEPKENNI